MSNKNIKQYIILIIFFYKISAKDKIITLCIVVVILFVYLILLPYNFFVLKQIWNSEIFNKENESDKNIINDTKKGNFILYILINKYKLLILINTMLNLAKKSHKVVQIPSSSQSIPDNVQYLLIGGGTASFAAFRAIKSADPTARVSY